MRYSSSVVGGVGSVDDLDLAAGGGAPGQQRWPGALPILARQRSLQRAVSEAPEDATSSAAVASGGGDGLQAEYSALAEEELADAEVDVELGKRLVTFLHCLARPR
jgi:hypothetical protein